MEALTVSIQLWFLRVTSAMLSALKKACLVKNLHKSSRYKVLLISTARSFATAEHHDAETKDRTINVEGININYVEVGKGEHPLLLFPGFLGSIWTDFKPQVEKLNRDKLRIVAWDPPGYGHSRQYNRTYPDDYMQKDAFLAHGLMKSLGYDSFSVLGWSDGANTSIIMATLYPKSIRKLITVAAFAYVSLEEHKMFEMMRNIDAWSERQKATMIALYGEDYFKSTAALLNDAKARIYEMDKGDLYKGSLSKVQCPTLLVHGAKDAIVHKRHSECLRSQISNARVHLFDQGGHNLHLIYAEEFNQLAEEFLLEK